MRYQLADHHAHHRVARATGNHRAVLQYGRDIRITSRPRRARTHQNASIPVGHGYRKVNGIAERGSRIVGRPNPDPRRADVPNGHM